MDIDRRWLVPAALVPLSMGGVWYAVTNAQDSQGYAAPTRTLVAGERIQPGDLALVSANILPGQRPYVVNAEQLPSAIGLVTARDVAEGEILPIAALRRNPPLRPGEAAVTFEVSDISVWRRVAVGQYVRVYGIYEPEVDGAEPFALPLFEAARLLDSRTGGGGARSNVTLVVADDPDELARIAAALADPSLRIFALPRDYEPAVEEGAEADQDPNAEPRSGDDATDGGGPQSEGPAP